jgi:hypothetical protein
MYCGTEIKGAPVHVDGERVTFHYAQMENRQPRQILGELVMFALGEGVLRGVLAKRFVGGTIEEWSDLEVGRKADACFYSYVIRKGTPNLTSTR